jgi:predicted lactoylglutathione lyase
MESRINLITLGVTDLKKSRTFYEALGWKASSASNDDVVFFKGKGIVLALYGWNALAQDAGIRHEGWGFRGIALAQNVHSKENVATLLCEVERAGGKVVKPAQDVFWGGHSGYFTDPDGHLWEVAWNPIFKLNELGEVELPE